MKHSHALTMAQLITNVEKKASSQTIAKPMLSACCSSCVHWGVNTKGEKTNALLNPRPFMEANKLCLKLKGKYTKSSFICCLHSCSFQNAF